MASLSSSRAPHARVPGAVPPGVRKPLPTFTHIWVALGIFLIVTTIISMTMGGFLNWITVVWAAWYYRRLWIRTVAEREELRWKNYEAVEDWIISAELPAPSDELVKREKEDARAYAALMAKQGKRPDGSQAPDPNSNRSKKRAERKARAAERRRMRELEQDYLSAMNVPPMILGDRPDPHSNAFVFDPDVQMTEQQRVEFEAAAEGTKFFDLRRPYHRRLLTDPPLDRRSY